MCAQSCDGRSTDAGSQGAKVTLANSVDGLPPLRAVVEKHGLAPKKSLGQNFLFDLNLTGKIARASGPLVGASVLEIGPGPGGLTRALLAGGAARVVAIERDSRCIEALQDIAARYPGKLEIVADDALTIDPETLVDGPYRIVANLPYNIGTELLVRWLMADIWPPRWASLTLMFQREVAERITAPPGSKSFGRLAVLAGWRCNARIMFDVPPQAFTPPPKVMSTVVSLTPKPNPISVRLGDLERVTASAFGQRRKMLRRSISALGGESILSKAGIDPTLRAEQLSIDDFCKIANAL